MSRRRRPASEERGRLGEDLGAAFLLRTGHRVVARNLRVAGAEIDILARRRRLYLAVEVKARTHHPAPERLVDPEQVARVRRALLALAPHLVPRPRALRVDLLAVVTPEGQAPEVRHFPGIPQAWPRVDSPGFWRRRLWTI